MLGKSLKTAAAGNAGDRYWLSLVGGAQGELGHGVAVHTDGSIVLCGDCNGGGGLIKYNSIGVIQWSKQFNANLVLRDVEFDSNGNIYVCGYTRQGTPGGIEELFVAKFNSSGTVQWQKRVLAGQSFNGWSISIDHTNSYIWAGGYVYDGTWFEHNIVKFDFNGTISDALGISGLGTYGGYPRRACVDSNGDFVLTGQFYHGGGGGLYSAYLVKFLAGGSSNWYQLYGDQGTLTSSTVAGEDVCYDSYSQHYFATGVHNGNAYLIKVSLTGALQWQKKMQRGANEVSRGYHVCSDGVGGIYVTGHTSKSGGAGQTIFIAKFGSNGSSKYYKTLDSGTTSTFEFGDGVAANSTGPFVAGSTNINTGPGSNDMILFHPSTGVQTCALPIFWQWNVARFNLHVTQRLYDYKSYL